jgi:hypothetical protein
MWDFTKYNMHEYSRITISDNVDDLCESMVEGG